MFNSRNLVLYARRIPTAISARAMASASSTRTMPDSMPGESRPADHNGPGLADESNSPTRQRKGVQDEHIGGGKGARKADNQGVDAASPNIRPSPKDKTKGNPEGVGMVDQVGSASGTKDSFEKQGKS